MEVIELKSMPFDSLEVYDESTGTTSYDRVAYSKDLADWMRNYFSNGILVKGSTALTNQLKVTHKSGLIINVDKGEIIINGRTGWVEEPIDITLDIGGAKDRIDRVVMELNIENRFIYLKVLKGVEADSPVAPALTQTEDIYQIPLAQVKVNALSADVGEVIDERMDISHVTIAIEPPRPVYANEAVAISVSDIVAEIFGLDEFSKDVEHALRKVPNLSYGSYIGTASSQTVEENWQEIHLGFKPKLVWILSEYSFDGYSLSQNGSYYRTVNVTNGIFSNEENYVPIDTSFGGTPSKLTPTLFITEDGFKVNSSYISSTQSSQTASYYSSMNSGAHFYLVFG